MPQVCSASTSAAVPNQARRPRPRRVCWERLCWFAAFACVLVANRLVPADFNLDRSTLPDVRAHFQSFALIYCSMVLCGASLTAIAVVTSICAKRPWRAVVPAALVISALVADTLGRTWAIFFYR